jgi:hypothetical protein
MRGSIRSPESGSSVSPSRFQPHFAGQEVLRVRFLGPGEDTVLHCHVGDLYDVERLRAEKREACLAGTARTLR